MQRPTLIYKVESVIVTSPYIMEVTFADGYTRTVDMKSELWGEMFEPLLDFELFSQAYVDTEFHTVAWPNGADIAPEFLREG